VPAALHASRPRNVRKVQKRTQYKIISVLRSSAQNTFPCSFYFLPDVFSTILLAWALSNKKKLTRTFLGRLARQRKYRALRNNIWNTIHIISLYDNYPAYSGTTATYTFYFLRVT